MKLCNYPIIGLRYKEVASWALLKATNGMSSSSANKYLEGGGGGGGRKWEEFRRGWKYAWAYLTWQWIGFLSSLKQHMGFSDSIPLYYPHQMFPCIFLCMALGLEVKNPPHFRSSTAVSILWIPTYSTCFMVFWFLLKFLSCLLCIELEKWESGWWVGVFWLCNPGCISLYLSSWDSCVNC